MFRDQSAKETLVMKIRTLLCLLALSACTSSSLAGPLPDPTTDMPLATEHGTATAVFAGGCFWGVEAVFENVKGVTDAVSGYSGGSLARPTYEQVGSGLTGHAESVRVTYDPSQITYGQLLKVFFAVAHDPTQLNRQGPDTGTQYRSAIFYANADQQRVAQAYIAQLDKAGVFKRPVVTQVNQLSAFYQAEAYHQDYATMHPENPYIAYNDAPKVENLKQMFPDVYRDKPVLVTAAKAAKGS